jgi:hypothetical protein
MDKTAFAPSVNQRHIVTIEGRINSLNVNKPEGYAGEVARLQHALADVLTRLSAEELQALRLSQNKIMTPEEEAVDRDRVRKAMDENRDKPSI